MGDAADYIEEQGLSVGPNDLTPANTIDSEVDKILHDIAEEAANYWDGGSSRSNSAEDLENEFIKARITITNLIAQEANKAVIKKLEDVMVKVDYTDSDTLITQKALRTHNNIQRELSRLTADKEQA